MNISDELTGTQVLVHPELSKNPTARAGQIGVINGIDREGANAYVGFGKNGQAMYGMDAVLVLRPAAEIQQALKEHGAKLSVQDHTALFRMTLLQECSPSSANTTTALNLAGTSEKVRELGTISVGEALGISQEQILEQWARR
ncbi:MAG TPA: hypothetical protein VFE53_24020 [Mucilaginibacter sp.]|jgi:hypothetical protein|nr:hypothetical protein [Mucilaginibacter sp.]